MPADTYRILVADDERPVLEAYRMVLADLNSAAGTGAPIEYLEDKLFGQPSSVDLSMPTFSPVLCRGGEEAVEAMRNARPGTPEFPVAFIDVRMPPGANGIETAARIRALNPEINIVIVTAYSDSDPREISSRVPPQDKLFYISKPFQKIELQQLVLALTAKWKAERSLRQLNQELTRKLLELEAAGIELEEARRKAVLASQGKSEFLANMSHELRTPLNATIGFTDIMRKELFGPIGNDRYRQYLDDISHSSTHLLRMINDLLDFAAIEAGKLRFNVERVELDEVINSAISLVQVQAEQAEVVLRQELRAARIGLQADEDRLRQIMLNLLSNAIKFTPKFGRVTVASAMEGDGILSISVADTGIGIAPENLSTILKPFGQVDRGLARKYPGTGLGLAIAKNLTELQGGVLVLASELGIGTTVTLRFPSDRCSGPSRRRPAGAA